MKKKVKTVILIQGTFHNGYKEFENAIVDTWLKEYEDIEIIRYYGYGNTHKPKMERLPWIHKPEEGKCTFKDGVLVCDTEDMYKIACDFSDPRPDKQIMAFEYVVNNYDFEYLYKISNIIYVHIPRLKDYLETLPNSRVYTGMKYRGEYDFMAGCHVIMSKDVVEKAVEHKELYLDMPNVYNHPNYEDVSLGLLLFYELKYVKWDDQKPNCPSFDYRKVKKEGIDFSNNVNIFAYQFDRSQAENMKLLHKQLK